MNEEMSEYTFFAGENSCVREARVCINIIHVNIVRQISEYLKTRTLNVGDLIINIYMKRASHGLCFKKKITYFLKTIKFHLKSNI